MSGVVLELFLIMLVLLGIYWQLHRIATALENQNERR